MSLLETSSKKSCHRGRGDEEEEDHKQEWISPTERQGCGRADSQRCQGGGDDADVDDDEETKTIVRAVLEFNNKNPPPFCSNRFGVGGRSSRGIPFMTQSPYQRHQPHTPSPTSTPRKQNEAQVLQVQEESEQAKCDSQDHAKASASLVVPIENDAKEELEDPGLSCSFSRIRRNLPPRKRVFCPEKTNNWENCASLRSDDSMQGHETDGEYLHATHKADQKVKNAMNVESKRDAVSNSPVTSPTTRREKFRFREKDDQQSLADQKKPLSPSASSAVGAVSHRALRSDLPDFGGPAAPSVALPDVSFLLPGPDSPQHSASSVFKAGVSTPGLLQSPTPGGCTATLFPTGAVAPETSFLVNSIASTTGVNPAPVAPRNHSAGAEWQLAAEEEQLTSLKQLASLASSYLVNGTSWLQSIPPSFPLMQLTMTTIPTSTNQQQVQGMHITAASSIGSNTDPVVTSRTHQRLLPETTCGGLVSAVTAGPHVLEHDERGITRRSPAQGGHFGMTSAAPSLDRTPQAGQHPTARRTSSRPAKYLMPKEDGSRDDPDIHDYLCGQGGHGVHHIGNKRVRDLIESLMPQFRASKLRSSSTPRTESARSKLVRAVIQDVHNRGGTFLKRDATGKKWVPASDREVVRKITQRFNEEACGRAQQHKSKKSRTS